MKSESKSKKILKEIKKKVFWSKPGKTKIDRDYDNSKEIKTALSNNFQKLTPYIDETTNQNENSYFQALDFVFQNSDLRNIGITGPYGAGKSSVFETYLHHRELSDKVIRISLTHFKTSHNNRDIPLSDLSRDNNDSFLEERIINHLIHQIDPDRIKKSSFIAQIKNYSSGNYFKALGIILALLILFNGPISRFFSGPNFTMFQGLVINFISPLLLPIATIIVVIVLFFILVDHFQRSKKNDFLQKITVANFSIDLVKNDEPGSFFDKYLSEIRYLFENCGANIIVFEDIDRFDVSDIFEKIRELNTIVNFSQNNSVIRFFYIINDSIFISKDRTKFFDFIIPVVPIIESSNSYSQLRKLLLLPLLNEITFDNQFVRGLASYIDDMRMLKNIINEFLIYKFQLSKEKLDPNKLLMFITYKVFFPKDFVDLQSGCGYLYSLINAKDQLVQQELSQIEEEIDLLKKEMYQIESEHLEDVNELGSLLIKLPNANSITGTNRSEKRSTLDTFTIYKKYYEDNEPNVNIINIGGAQVDLKEAFQTLYSNTDYSSRKNALTAKAEGKIVALRLQIEKIEKRKNTLTTSRIFSELVNTSNIDAFLKKPFEGKDGLFEFANNDQSSRLISFLIYNGMIDGRYEDYLSYFYESEISFQDYRFLRSTYNRKPLPSDFHLDNPSEVLDRLKVVNPTNPALLNEDLLFLVWDNKDEANSILALQLCMHENQTDIIKEYILSRPVPNHIVDLLGLIWPAFYSQISSSKTPWKPEEINYYIVNVLHSKDENLIELSRGVPGFKSNVENNADLLFEISEREIETVIQNIKKLEIFFPALPAMHISGPLLELIYENDLYQLSVENILFWLENKYMERGKINSDKLLTCVFSKKHQNLYVYVQKNLGSVIEAILEQFPGTKFEDNSQQLGTLVCSDAVEISTKEKYASRSSSSIIELSPNFTKENVDLLLKFDKIDYNFKNILQIFQIFEFAFPQNVVTFLVNHKDRRLVDLRIDLNLFPSNILSELFKKTLMEPGLEFPVCQALFKASGIKLSTPPIGVDSEKVRALISSNALVMNDENLKIIRSSYSNHLDLFINQNIKEYVNTISTSNQKIEEVLRILKSDLNGNLQIRLVARFPGPIPYDHSFTFPSVKKYLLQKKFIETDIEQMLMDKSIIQEERFTLIILENISSHLDYVIENNYAIPHNILIEIISTSNISKENILKLFSNSLGQFTDQQIVELIVSLKHPIFSIVMDDKRPHYDSNALDDKILNVLIERKLISRGGNGQLYSKKKLKSLLKNISKVT